MGRGLARRLRRIVAGGAGTRRHAGVREGRRLPGRGAVAGIAGRAGGHVPARLARRAAAVVAGGAASGRHGRMGEARRCPGRRAVASLARRLRGDVVRPLGRDGEPAAGRVARGAIARRAAEDALHVARLAAHRLVGAGEREPRRHVVEAARGPLCRCKHGQQQSGCREARKPRDAAGRSIESLHRAPPGFPVLESPARTMPGACALGKDGPASSGKGPTLLRDIFPQSRNLAERGRDC